MRRILTILAALVVVVALAGVAVATGGGSSVTKARLERSLATSFANVYAQQAVMLGHQGVTSQSLQVRVMCDNGGSNVGPSASWICLTSWHDPNTPMPPQGYGKFELTARSNDCYTAGGPSSLIGTQTLTDVHGHTVTNPVFEFDGCFDPHSDNTPTGVSFPSALTVTNTSVNPSADGHVNLELACGTGAGGCHGRAKATAGGRSLGDLRIDMPENTTRTMTVPVPVSSQDKEVDVAIALTKGFTSGPLQLPVTG